LPEEFIEKVIAPFVPQITSRQFNVFICRRNKFDNFKIKADWNHYQLILFNLIQNAVKYN
jgi:K+-sensing histidine kinase KdpD